MSQRIDEALERGLAYLAGRTSVAAVLAREALGRTERRDHERRCLLARWIRDSQRPNGSFQGGLVSTSRAIEDLLALGIPEPPPLGVPRTRWPGLNLWSDPHIKAARRFLAARLGKEPRYSAPGASALPDCLAPLSDELDDLPEGLRVRSASARLLIAHLVGARGLILVGGVRQLEQNLEAVCAMPRLWSHYGGFHPPTTLFAGLSLLAVVPADLHTSAPALLEQGMDLLGTAQMASDLWRPVPMVRVCRTLVSLGLRGRSLCVRAAEALLASQRPSGAWGRRNRDERTALALCVLRLARGAGLGGHVWGRAA